MQAAQATQDDPPAVVSDHTEQRPSLHFVDQDPLPYCSPESHYQISTSKKFHWDITAWLGKNSDDIAVQVRNFKVSTVRTQFAELYD
jgi:hypothetical protein